MVSSQANPSACGASRKVVASPENLTDLHYTMLRRLLRAIMYLLIWYNGHTIA
jgi:hypothetical protein